jgi:hypothetical protein
MPACEAITVSDSPGQRPARKYPPIGAHHLVFRDAVSTAPNTLFCAPAVTVVELGGLAAQGSALEIAGARIPA